MPVSRIDIAEPFFTVRLIQDEQRFEIDARSILLNVGPRPVRVEQQRIEALTSVIVQQTVVHDVEACILIDGFDCGSDETAVLERIRQTWPTAFEIRGEERLRGVEHYCSPKVWIGGLGLTFYHSASVPLNVGLHRDHPFCPVPGFREVHTQIMGLGKMQQCREKSLDTLYLEEIMAPGMTHRPMFDADGNYPWHQFETITPSVFLALEMLPDGVPAPQ